MPKTNSIKNQKNKFVLGLCLLFLIFSFLSSFDFAGAQGFAPQKLPTGVELLPRGAGTAASGALGKLGTAGGVAAGFLSKVGETAEWGLAIFGLLQVLYHLLFWFVTFAYGLLNSAVSMALNPYWFQMPAINTAWQLVRDLVNVWFILIFLFIAIGTILRVSSFQAKKLLPIMIMMALVVNFSLPVSKFIIDVANIISFQFLNSICEERVDSQSGLKTCDVSANLENALDSKIFTQALQELPEKSQTQPQNPQQNTTPNNNNSGGANLIVPSVHAQGGPAESIFTGYVIAQAVVGTIALLTAGWGAIQTYLGNSSVLGIATEQFIGILVSDIFLAVTAYVILSLAILFIIRIVTLLFLVIISPLGLVMTAMPGAQSYGKMWWDKLLTQSFFAPLALFFLWISIALMGELKSALETPAIAPYANYNLENPANIRLIFYMFSIVLLYASLWISRKMGAIGAGALMKWADTARSAITGFVGGVAARNLWAPVGAAGVAAGIPEKLAKIPLVGPLAGITAKQALEKIAKAGKAPEQAAAKAELGSRLAPADRAAYFAKLDQAAKLAMLRKMKGDERESLIAGLSKAVDEDGNPILTQQAAAQDARRILGSYAFTGEEQLKTEAEEFKYKNTLPEQWGKFGTLPEDVRKQVLLSIEDAEKRAQFLQKVKEVGGAEGLAAFNAANAFLEENPGFSSNQKYANTLARWKVEGTEAQKNNELALFFENIKNEAEQKNRFKFATNELQKLELFETYSESSPELFKKLQGWLNETDPVEQDKFYRDYIGKRASSETVVAFIKAVDIRDKEGNKGEKEKQRDIAIKKKILSGASAAQLGVLARDNKDDAELLSTIDEYVLTMTDQNKNVYTKNKDRIPGNIQEMVESRTAKELANELRTRSDKKETKLVESIVEVIRTTDRVKDLDILTKIEFINKVDPKSIDAFHTALVSEINTMSPKTLEQKITLELLGDARIVNAIFEKGNIQKLLPLLENPAKTKKLQEIMLGNITNTMKDKIDMTNRAEGLTQQEILAPLMQNRQFREEAIRETFEVKFKNKELANELIKLWEKEKGGIKLIPVEKMFKKEIFGE